MYESSSDQENQSSAILLLFAKAVLERCELPNDGEIVQCQKMAGRNTFVDLYTKSVDGRYRIKKTNDIWRYLERGEAFEGVVYGFQKSIKYAEEIRKIDPKMFVGPNVSRKTPRMCTLRFRKVIPKQLLVDFQEIMSQYPTSLRSFDTSQNMMQLADDVMQYISKASHIWVFTHFAVPSRWITKRKEQIEKTRRNRGSMEPSVAVTWTVPEKPPTKQYGLIEDDGRYRVKERIYSRSKKLKNFDFGNTCDEIRESCIFLHSHVKSNKKTALQNEEPFYKGAPCDFSISHHPRLPVYPIRFTETAQCCACIKLWPKTATAYTYKKRKSVMMISRPRSLERRKRLARLPDTDSSGDESEDQKRQFEMKFSQPQGTPLVTFQVELSSPSNAAMLVGMYGDGSLAPIRTESESKSDAEEDDQSDDKLEVPAYRGQSDSGDEVMGDASKQLDSSETYSENMSSTFDERYTFSSEKSSKMEVDG